MKHNAPKLKKSRALSEAPAPNLNKETVAKLAREVARQKKMARKAARKGNTEEPRYDTGLTFDTPGLHYAVTATTPPVNDGGKVKLELDRKSDTELVNFTLAHIVDITGNENFTDPLPPATDFQALADTYTAAVTAKLNAKNALRDATATCDAARLALSQAFSVVRGPYVQLASNGNTQVILSAGLPVRNPRTPTGDLPSPGGLTVMLNGNSGVMDISWLAVTKARGYSLQYSPADTMERNWTVLATVNRTKFTAVDMTIGKAYAFRVAANGGASDQSFWSPEVVRMAA